MDSPAGPLSASISTGVREMTASTDDINILPPELLGRIFSGLEDKERCRIVPLVSSGFRHIHKDYPPQRIKWRHSDGQRIDESMVEWFTAISGGIEYLDIEISDFLPRLVMAAVRAPCLKLLRISRSYPTGGPLSPFPHSLAFLSQLKALVLECWEFPLGLEVGEMQCLTGLRSLEAISLDIFHSDEVEKVQAAALWSALSQLENLRTVRIRLWEDDDEPGDDHETGFFDSVSLLTQIRCIKMLVNHQRRLNESFRSLTQLTSITVEHDLPLPALEVVFGLPLLKHLAVLLNGSLSVPALPWRTASPYLTRLELEGCDDETAEDEADIKAVAALIPPHIVALRLGLSLSRFPCTLTRKLTSLQHLYLTEPRFGRLQNVLSGIATLQTLTIDFGGRLPEGLDDGDLATVAGLPNLQELKSGSCGLTNLKAWSRATKTFMDAMRMQFSHVALYESTGRHGPAESAPLFDWFPEEGDSLFECPEGV